MTLADFLVICGFIAVGMFMTAVDIVVIRKARKDEDKDDTT
nr:MAG TPA: hypothetical protein [Caudoviricetes sp.]